MRFTFANEPISRKPDASEMWYFQGLKNYSSLDLTVDKIAEMCGSGYAWRASIYNDMNGTAGKKNCIGSQIISLDFDNCEKSPWEVMEYAENRGIPANFFYFTYSQNPTTVYAEMSRVPFKEKRTEKSRIGFRPIIYIKGRKLTRDNLAPNLQEQPHYKESWNFRVCWILEKATTPKDYELLVRIFMEDYFSEFHPDEACKDISRVWFGGNLGAFLYRTEPFSYQQFGYEKVIKKNEECSNYENRRIKRSKDGFIKAYADMEEPNAVEVSNNWWEYLNKRCDIWDRYQRGEYVPHNDMFKLCCELKYLKPLDTSRSIFKDIMRFYDPQVYEGHSFNEELLAKWFRDRTLKPVAGLVRADNGRMMTIPQFFSQIRGVGRKNSLEKTSLEVLDNWMDEKVPALLDNDRTIYLKSQTGSGKTARILDWIAKQNLFNKKIVYAAPTHALLNQVHADFSKISSAPCYQCSKQELGQRDMLLLQLGLPKSAGNPEQKEFINNLFDEKKPGLFLVTHSLLINLEEVRASVIIIDENIEDALLRNSKISAKQIYSLGLFFPQFRDEINELVDEINSLPRNSHIDASVMREKVLPQLKEDVVDYLDSCGNDQSQVPSGLFDLMEYEAKTSTIPNSNEKCIRILRKSPLIENAYKAGIPIKMFSATPLSSYLTSYYKIDIDLIEAPLARNQGRIIQYVQESGAKGKRVSADYRFENMPKLVKYIKSRLDEETIKSSLLISFKGTAHYFAEQGFNVATLEGEEIHFMNNAGLNNFTGKDIIVVGKFDKPQEYYEDVWSDIGDGSEIKRVMTSYINLNGFEQQLYLWDKEELRDIQIQNIEYAVAQTVGRARALRKNANVYLFSNMVIVDVDEVYF